MTNYLWKLRGHHYKCENLISFLLITWLRLIGGPVRLSSASQGDRMSTTSLSWLNLLGQESVHRGCLLMIQQFRSKPHCQNLEPTSLWLPNEWIVCVIIHQVDLTSAIFNKQVSTDKLRLTRGIKYIIHNRIHWDIGWSHIWKYINGIDISTCFSLSLSHEHKISPTFMWERTI